MVPSSSFTRTSLGRVLEASHGFGAGQGFPIKKETRFLLVLLVYSLVFRSMLDTLTKPDMAKTSS
jgi:hypothetical protein